MWVLGIRKEAYTIIKSLQTRLPVHIQVYLLHAWILQDTILSSWSLQWGVYSCRVVSRVPGGKERHLHCDPGRPQCLCHLAACTLLHQHSPSPPVEVWSSKTTMDLHALINELLLTSTSLEDGGHEDRKGSPVVNCEICAMECFCCTWTHSCCCALQGVTGLCLLSLSLVALTSFPGSSFTSVMKRRG